MTTDDAIIRHSFEEPSAFGALFERHGRVIHRYVARRVGAAVADDVMSETFLIAFARRDSFDLTRTDARPWLYGIAGNLVSRHFAAETRRFAAMAATPVDHVTADAFERVTDRLDAIAHVGALGRAIAALTKADRDTLLLYAWGDLDYEGVAQATGAAIGTVKSRLNRARRRLRHAITTNDAPDANQHTAHTVTERGAQSWTN